MTNHTECNTKELNVTIRQSSLVTPETESERKCFFLSNLDQMLNIKIGVVFFFSKSRDFPSEIVADRVETALRKLLVPYDFVAGRLKSDQNGRFEIDCNSSGAGFIVALSDLSLEDLGDLVKNPNQDNEKLAATELPGFQVNSQPLLILQITAFKCGGFAMGMVFNHMLFDGNGLKIFLENLASLTRNNSIVLDPQNNRHLLSARSPSEISFTHPEMFKLDQTPLGSTSNKIKSKAIRLSANDIARLRVKAKMEDEGKSKDTEVTNYNVVAAHIWRCVTLAKQTKNEPINKTSSLIYAIDIRQRVRPPLPSSYTGNAIFGGYCTATYEELEKGPFSLLVQRVAQAEKQVTNEYIASGIDWLEVHKGYMNGDVCLSSWRKLGLNDTIYPWGKPKWNSPVLQNNAVLLLPDIEQRNGVIIIVSLQAKEMENFEFLFSRFLGELSL